MCWPFFLFLMRQFWNHLLTCKHMTEEITTDLYLWRWRSKKHSKPLTWCGVSPICRPRFSMSSAFWYFWLRKPSCRVSTCSGVKLTLGLFLAGAADSVGGLPRPEQKKKQRNNEDWSSQSQYSEDLIHLLTSETCGCVDTNMMHFGLKAEFNGVIPDITKKGIISALNWFPDFPNPATGPQRPLPSVRRTVT